MSVDIQTSGIFDPISDAADWVGDRLNDGWDLVDDLPILKQFGDATKALFTGPLRDFANTDFGKMVVRAMTSMAMGPVGWAAGPWAMMVSASMPGLVRGDSFTEAILAENLWRLEETIKILAPGMGQAAGEAIGAQFGEQLARATEHLRALAENFPGGNVAEKLNAAAKQMGFNLEDFARAKAREMGLREDLVVEAVELLAEQKLLTHELYDLATGAKNAPMPKTFLERATSTVATATRPSASSFLSKATVSMSTPLSSSVFSRANVSPIASAVRPMTSPIAKSVDLFSAFQASSLVPAPPPPPPPPPPVLDRATAAYESSPAPEQGGGKTLAYVGAAGMLGLAVWWYMRHRR